MGGQERLRGARAGARTCGRGGAQGAGAAANRERPSHAAPQYRQAEAAGARRTHQESPRAGRAGRLQTPCRAGLANSGAEAATAVSTGAAESIA